MRDGWIKLHRKLQEKGFYKKPKYAHLWVHLLLEANHKPQEVMWNGKTIMLKPGQFITGRKILALNSGIDESSIQRILHCFKNAHQIEQQTTNQNRLITILKWKQYQGNEQQNEQPVNNGRTTDEQQNEQRKNSQEVSSKRQIGNQQVISEQQNEQQMNNKTTKRVKKESNIKKEINKNKKEEDLVKKHSPFDSFKDDILSFWNTFVSKYPALPKLISIAGDRKHKLKLRYSDTIFREKWKEIFLEIEKSDFLQGKNGKWRCTFDFIIANDRNYLKILEGNYRNKKGRAL